MREPEAVAIVLFVAFPRVGRGPGRREPAWDDE